MAKRLRNGQLHSEFGNVVSSQELADIYDLTIRRDEIFETAHADVSKAIAKLGDLIKEEGTAVRDTFYIMLREAEEEARILGPGSEAARRVQQMNFIREIAKKNESDYRRQGDDRIHISPPMTKSFAGRVMGVIFEMTAAEILDAPPPGETILSFPAEGGDPARERVLFRIGVDDLSWIASFERGNTEHCTVQMLPDWRHFLVCAGGAGYIIDVESRTLVERLGDDIVEIGDAYNRSVYFVNHGNRSLEAFGMPGRLWKTEEISCGGFRNLDVDGETFVGEARRESDPEWVRFSVKLANGEVTLRDA
jgi:hypothetical protein